MGAISPEAVERLVWGETPVVEQVNDRDPFDDHQVVGEQPAMTPPPD